MIQNVCILLLFKFQMSSVLNCVMQVLNEDDFQKWANFRREAEAAIDNRDELLMETAQHLETKLTLLGS